MHLPSPGVTRDPARGRVRHDSEGPAPARGHIASVSRPSSSSRGVPRRREPASGHGGTATLGLRRNFSNGILHLSRLWTDWDVFVGSPGRRPPARIRVCPGFRRATRHRRRDHRPRRTADAPRLVPKLLKRTSRCEKLHGGPAKPGPAAPPASRMACAASTGRAASAGCAGPGDYFPSSALPSASVATMAA